MATIAKLAKETLQVRPYAVTAAAWILVVLYTPAVALLDWHFPLYSLLKNAGDGAAVAVALGLASIAATAAGFVGVIVVFGLSGESDALARFRQRTHTYMRPNWVSVIGSSFASSAAGVCSALLIASGHYDSAAATLCLAIVFLSHALIRVLWLFRTLMDVMSVSYTHLTLPTSRLV